MTDTDIDESLNTFLGLPVAYPINKIEAFKIYEYFNKLFPSGKPIRGWTLEYYVDKHGDFVNKPKTRRDYIVKEIFNNLESSEQYDVLKYIAEHLEEINA